MNRSHFLGLLLVGALGTFGCGKAGGEQPAGGATAESSAPKIERPKELELLNVSYDPTRELWRDLNEKLIAS